MKGKIGNVTLFLGTLLVLLLAVGATALLSIQELNTAWRWEKRSYEVLGQCERLLSALADIESAARGYVISGDAGFLDPLHAARPQIEDLVRNLRTLTSDNALQQKEINQLEPLLTESIIEVNRVIGTRAVGKAGAAQTQVSRGEGKRLMDDTRQIITELENEERRLLNNRDRAELAAVQREQATVFGGSALALGIVAAALVLTARENRSRQQAEEALHTQQEHLEETVQQRTAELAITNKELREREAELREAQRITKVGNWKIENETISWSEEMFHIFGRDPSSPPPSFSERRNLFTPQSWARIRVAIGTIGKTGIPGQLDLEILCPGGTPKWITARGEVIRGQQGEILALRGTAQDITERVGIEQKYVKARSGWPESSARPWTALLAWMKNNASWFLTRRREKCSATISVTFSASR